MTTNTQKNPEINQIKPIISLLNIGKTQEALSIVNNLTKDFPNSSLLFNISGACYKANNNLEKAVESFKRAISIKPDFAEALYNLGVIQKELGQIKSSINSYEKAIDIKPAYPDAHNNLGNIFLKTRQLDTAIDHFEWAVAFKPDFYEAYNNLGLVRLEQNQINKAIKNFKKAIAINSQYSEAYINLGQSLKDLGQMNDAVKCYKELITVNPSFAKGYLSIGVAYKAQGLIDKAINNLEKALSIDPSFGVIYYNLGIIKEYVFSKAQISKMKSLLSSKEISSQDRINLSFALAQVNEDLDDKDQFFKFLHEGNRLRKIDLNYSIDSVYQNHAVIRKIFSVPPVIKKPELFQKSNKQPIFIVGMPRSGSSLVEQILASHKSVFGGGEMQVLRKILNPVLRDYLAQENIAASTSIGGKKIQLISTENISEEAFLSIREKYLDSISNFDFPENIFTDKSLLNFHFIGFIFTAFPEAKIIHLKRDARAICWSIYKHNLPQKGNGFANNLEDLAEFYKLYSKLMNFWHELFPNKIYDLVYEDLTSNQEEETKKLVEYCELEWDENCLNFHNSKREVQTASVLQVRKKMYQGSSEAWKEYESYLKPLLNALNKF
jgi:Tfp pilus assembly protein PilF